MERERNLSHQPPPEPEAYRSAWRTYRRLDPSSGSRRPAGSAATGRSSRRACIDSSSHSSGGLPLNGEKRRMATEGRPSSWCGGRGGRPSSCRTRNALSASTRCALPPPATNSGQTGHGAARASLLTSEFAECRAPLLKSRSSLRGMPVRRVF